jgi:hypothetical protein
MESRPDNLTESFIVSSENSENSLAPERFAFLRRLNDRLQELAIYAAEHNMELDIEITFKKRSKIIDNLPEDDELPVYPEADNLSSEEELPIFPDYAPQDVLPSLK